MSLPWFMQSTAQAPTGAQPVATAIGAILKGNRQYYSQAYSSDYAATFYYERDRLQARYGGLRGAYSAFGNSIRGHGDYLGDAVDGLPDVQSPSIVQSATDTVTNWLFSESPPVGVKASNLPLEAQSSVEMYSLALDSIFNTDENADIESMLARDGTLKGFGCAWPQFIDGEIRLRRLVSHQFWADAHDARDGRPKCIYVTEYRDKYALADWVEGFKELPHQKAKVDAVRALPVSDHNTNGSDEFPSIYEWETRGAGVPDYVPRVRVTHAWRLASKNSKPDEPGKPKGREDGRYTCIVGEGDKAFSVLDQPFHRTTSPVVWWTPSPSDEGIRGMGMYHALALWQRSIDFHMQRIQRTTTKFGWPKVLLPRSEEQQAEGFASMGVRPLFANSMSPQAKPVVIPGIPLLAEDIAWVEKLMSMSLDLAGVNSLMASGGSRLGAGASAVALVEENFRATDRLSLHFERFKRFKLKLARQVLHCLDDTLAVQPDYAAEFLYKGERHSMKWADLQKQTSGWAVDVEIRGTSSRANRVSKILDTASRNLISEDVAKEALLLTPDFRRAANMATVGLRLVDWQLDVLVRSGSDAKAGKQLDLAFAINDMDVPTLQIAVERSTKMLMRAVMEAGKPETRTKLRDYKKAAEDLLRSRLPQPELAPEMAAPGASTAPTAPEPEPMPSLAE